MGWKPNKKDIGARMALVEKLGYKTTRKEQHGIDSVFSPQFNCFWVELDLEGNSRIVTQRESWSSEEMQAMFSMWIAVEITHREPSPIALNLPE